MILYFENVILTVCFCLKFEDVKSAAVFSFKVFGSFKLEAA